MSKDIKLDANFSADVKIDPNAAKKVRQEINLENAINNMKNTELIICSVFCLTGFPLSFSKRRKANQPP